MRLFGQKESERKAGNSRISDRFCEITEFFGDCFPVLFERYREELVPFLYGFTQSIEDAEELMPDSFAEVAAGPTAFFVKRSVDRKQTKTEQNQHGGKMMKTNRNNDPWIRGISLLLSLLMCVAQRHCTFGAWKHLIRLRSRYGVHTSLRFVAAVDRALPARTIYRGKAFGCACTEAPLCKGGCRL